MQFDVKVGVETHRIPVRLEVSIYSEDMSKDEPQMCYLPWS